jgi:hypothetical protein
MLVDARITLDVIGPGIGSAAEAAIQPGTVVREMSSYHFDAGFGFSGYVAATGGLRKNRNDVRAEIHTSVEYGTAYYTISYRPSLRDFDGQFRRIHVTVKGHPEWTVLTKAGYYGMQFGGEKDAEHQQVSDLSMATFEPMPFEAIGATLIKIERIKNTGKTRFTFQLDSEDLQWNADSTTKVRETDVTVSGAALGSVFLNKTLASEISTWKLTVPLETDKQPILSEVAVTLQIPPKTERLRFAVRDAANGRMGTVDLNPKAVVGAPEVDAPIPPVLTPRVAAPGR